MSSREDSSTNMSIQTVTPSTVSGDEVIDNNKSTEKAMSEPSQVQEGLKEEDVKTSIVRFCAFVVAKPKLSFGITLALHLFMILLTVILLVSGYDILPIDFGGLPLDLPEDSTKLRADAWLFALEDDEISAMSGGQLERGVRYQSLQLVYEGDNVFTKESLKTIKYNEEKLFNKTDYRNKLCQLIQASPNGSRTCKPPLSILRFFDGSYSGISPVFNDPHFDNISGVLYAAKVNNLSKALLNYHLGKDAKITKTKASSPYTRSIMYIGWPYAGYTSTEDRKDDQTDKINKIVADTYAETLTNLYNDGIEDLKFYYNCQALLVDALTKQVVLNLMLAVASFIFIFLFMWLQTGSLWITSWAVFSVLSSFNITNLIYRIVFDYRYIGIFHVLSIFIILGIGADDVFVFMDTWKQSQAKSYKSLVHRLSDVYRHAAKAMFITSFTTIVAFLSNVSSPLLAISSFGLFSAILVTVNYLSVILFFPTVVMVHHLSRRGQCCCCTLCCCNNNSSLDNIPTESKENLAANNSPHKKTFLERIIDFFGGWFFRNIIAHKIVRWVILVIFFAFIGVSIGFATQLKPATEQTKLWGPDTNWAKVDDLNQNAFVKSQEDNVVVVTIIWGLKEQDRSECHHTDYKCKGKTVLDRSFDMNPPPCQTAMMDFCKNLRNLPEDKINSLRVRRSEVTGEIETKCFLERMDEYLEDEGKKDRYPNGSDFSLVINGNNMRELMKYNPQLYNVSSLSQSYYRYFEVGVGFFITNGGEKRYAETYDFKKYGNLIGGAADPTLHRNASRNQYLQGNKYGHRIAFVGIQMNTTLNPASLGYEEGLPIYRKWEDFVSGEMKDLPSSCSNGFQATVSGYNIWHWLKVQEILVINALKGIIIGLCLALVILVVATTNLAVGVVATLIIALITCSVLGVINMIGWKLGPLESLNLTLVVGLAVDYVVHLAEGYMELKNETREAKVKHTLTHVGVSVLSGACTTLGASIFLLAAKILFFFQFGIFIFCTIGFSIMYSLFFFPTVMALIGPEGENGSIMPAVRWIRDVVRGKTKHDKNCEQCKGKGFYRKNLISLNPNANSSV